MTNRSKLYSEGMSDSCWQLMRSIRNQLPDFDKPVPAHSLQRFCEESLRHKEVNMTREFVIKVSVFRKYDGESGIYNVRIRSSIEGDIYESSQTFDCEKLFLKERVDNQNE